MYKFRIVVVFQQFDLNGTFFGHKMTTVCCDLESKSSREILEDTCRVYLCALFRKVHGHIAQIWICYGPIVIKFTLINCLKKSLTHHHHHCRQMNSSSTTQDGFYIIGNFLIENFYNGRFILRSFHFWLEYAISCALQAILCKQIIV